jgi:hypothetical protein
VIAGASAFGFAPYAEELVRCLRADRSLRARPEAPEAAAPTPTLRIPGDGQ